MLDKFLDRLWIDSICLLTYCSTKHPLSHGGLFGLNTSPITLESFGSNFPLSLAFKTLSTGIFSNLHLSGYGYFSGTTHSQTRVPQFVLLHVFDSCQIYNQVASVKPKPEDML